MTHLEKNIQALASGTNEPLAKKLVEFLQNSKCTRFYLDENLNIFDQKNQVFMYNYVEQEIAYFQNAILEKTLRYPFVCIYGIGNALLIKNLVSFYKHIFVFESEIELFILALSVADLSEELSSGKVYLIDTFEEKINIQLSILFDQKDMFEYLNLYEMFMSNAFYEKYFMDEMNRIDGIVYDNINLVIRNLEPDCKISLICYENFINNIPLMIKGIPFQRIISERKAKFENCIVVCAGPSLEKQIALLKKYQENFVIFCVDGAFSLLYKNDIIPDYVLNLDYTELPLKFFENIQIEKLKSTLFLLAIGTNQKVVLDIVDKDVYFSLVLSDHRFLKQFSIKDFGYLDVGTHVGHMCYTLAIALEFKNIVIIGQDLAYNQEGNSHFKDFALGKNIDTTLKIPNFETLAYGGKGKVLTHLAWNDYRKKIEYLFLHNPQVNFYNSTEGGARIAFAKELSFEECCIRFAQQKKQVLDIPKPLTQNRSDKVLNKVLQRFNSDLKQIHQVLEDAKALHNALETILSSEKNLPLEFLANVYKNIENFDFLLEQIPLIDDGVLRGVLFARGNLLSEVIAKKTNDEQEYLLLFFKAYREWLNLFIEKFSKREAILSALV
ncbi:motility associated factor glycosyltransferase family protein [Campylobacter estrildidarum]|uniref:Motility accessory factor n=1 Tax=Campylobacter estrildidarum TaxID=2510189 RepID=A0A4U7BK21_9BACT|nr:motility associated factor glycosyltransferase family protein [Campylobacter estrildidarum]TKX30545.1 motility accessory factor [Campylobacter estrildidarum]